MAKHLQIEIDVDSLDGIDPNVKVTPIDIAIPDAVATAVQEAIAVGDVTDAVPGDGVLEEKTSFKTTVKANFLFVHLNVPVDAELEAVVRVVDRA